MDSIFPRFPVFIQISYAFDAGSSVYVEHFSPLSAWMIKTAHETK